MYRLSKPRILPKNTARPKANKKHARSKTKADCSKLDKSGSRQPFDCDVGRAGLKRRNPRTSSPQRKNVHHNPIRPQFIQDRCH